jgi:hypothetical protein
VRRRRGAAPFQGTPALSAGTYVGAFLDT